MKGRPIKYLFVGIGISIFNFLLYTAIANLIFRDSSLLWLASLISTTASVFVAYFLHSRITWQEKHPGRTGIIRFFIWNVIEAIIINPGLTWFFGLLEPVYNFFFNISSGIGLPFDRVFIESTGAFIFTSIVTMILNYLFYDKFVFSSTKNKKNGKLDGMNKEGDRRLFAFPNFFYRKNMILLKELTKTDFKLRYQGSVLGYLWALLRPLMMFAILYIVFAKLLRFGSDIPHYPVYLLTGTTLWSFFTECTSQGINAIVNRGDLLRKICFPKYIVVVSATLSAVINLLINLVVIVIFAFVNGVTISWTWFLVPLLCLELYLLSLGISFLLGAINVKYRDVVSIWDVCIQALFYAVPIIYPISMVASSSKLAAEIILLNPIAQVIQDIRYCLVTTETTTVWNFVENPSLIAIPFLIVILILIWGSYYFRKKSKKFAEEV